MVSFEFGKRLVEEGREQLLGEQAERELAVGQDAVGIELSVEPLQLTIECLSGTDCVTGQFVIYRPELLESLAPVLPAGLGSVAFVPVLALDQRRFAFDEFGGLAGIKKFLCVVEHPAESRGQLATVHG